LINVDKSAGEIIDGLVKKVDERLEEKGFDLFRIESCVEKV